MNLPKLRVKFTDFPPTFNPERSVFTRQLSRYFTVERSDDPELLVYSVFGTDFARYPCRRIFYTAENVRPDFDACDFAVTFDYLEDPRHVRWPMWIGTPGPQPLLKRPDEPSPEQLLQEKTKFCAFVVSNGGSAFRNYFFKRLSRYKRVDSGGRYQNNIGGPVANKLEFYRPYKFVLCFENSAHPGYTTEKLPHAMAARCVPIYWGDPTVGRDFNERSFIRVRSVWDAERAIERIIAADRDDALYTEYLRQPYFHGNVAPANADNDALGARLLDVVRSNTPPVGRSALKTRLAVARVRRRQQLESLHVRLLNTAHALRGLLR